MSAHSSAIVRDAAPISSRSGIGWGLLGILAFSLTVPLTRVAADDGLSPLFIGAGRAVVAAALAAAVLVATRQVLPTTRQW